MADDDTETRLTTRLWDAFARDNHSAVEQVENKRWRLPLVKSDKIVFGEDLHHLLEREERSVPYLVETCIQYLVLHRVINKQEGVFRLSGPSSDIRFLKTSFQEDADVMLELVAESLSTAGISIAALLKAYLRELPCPLVPVAVYQGVVEAFKLDDADVHLAACRRIFENADEGATALLSVLLLFLGLVAEYAISNKMPSSNLAMVFGPNVLRDPSASVEEEMRDSAAVNRAMEFMIDHAEMVVPSNDGTWAMSLDTTLQALMGGSAPAEASTEDEANGATRTEARDTVAALPKTSSGRRACATFRQHAWKAKGVCAECGRPHGGDPDSGARENSTQRRRRRSWLGRRLDVKEKSGGSTVCSEVLPSPSIGACSCGCSNFEAHMWRPNVCRNCGHKHSG